MMRELTKIQVVNNLFSSMDGEFCKFYLVERKLSNRRDVHAIKWLDEKFPSSALVNNELMHVVGADNMAFSIDISGLEVLTESDIKDLVRCGVSFDHYNLQLVLWL